MLRWSKALLQDSRNDPSSIMNICIRVSSNHGNTEVVRLLLGEDKVKETLGNRKWNSYLEKVDRYMQ